MSIVVRFPPSGMTRQQYDSVRNALTDSDGRPRDIHQRRVRVSNRAAGRVAILGVPIGRRLRRTHGESSRWLHLCQR